MKKAFAYLFCVLIFISCKKKEPEPPPQKTTYQKSVWYSDSLNPYKFKIGTHWTYQKVSTSITDYVNVANTFITNCNHAPCSVHGVSVDTCFTYYGYAMEFHSNYSNVSTNITLFGNYITSMDQWCQNYPFYSCKYNAQWDTTYPKLFQMASNLTVTIGSNTFNNVVKMKCANQGAFVFNSITKNVVLYWCPNIGIVRKEIEVSPSVIETWDLISYSIVM